MLATRDEVIQTEEGTAFVCPECRQALVDTSARPGKKPIAVQVIILGGISLLVLMGAGAVYYEVLHIKNAHPQGQIGTSFEQAEVAGEHGEFLPSRHMPATPSPAPVSTVIPAASPASQP